MNRIERLRSHVRDVPDFPLPGILFKDITPLLSNASLLRDMISLFSEACTGLKPCKIAGIEARGFIIGTAVAAALGVGFVPIRKKGKLPAATFSREYALEYGTAGIEVHVDAFERDERVVLVDDLLATGGTARAAAQLITEAGAQLVEIQFLIELEFLSGRNGLAPCPVRSFLKY